MGEPAITPVSQRPATARSGGKKDQNADDKKDIAIDTDGNTAERTTSENVESRAAAALRSFGNSASQISPFVGAGLGTALGGPLGGAAAAGAFAGLPALGQAAAKAWEALSNRGGGGSCGPEGCPPGRGTPGTPPSGSTPPSGRAGNPITAPQQAAIATVPDLAQKIKDLKPGESITVGFVTQACGNCASLKSTYGLNPNNDGAVTKKTESGKEFFMADAAGGAGNALSSAFGITGVPAAVKIYKDSDGSLKYKSTVGLDANGFRAFRDAAVELTPDKKKEETPGSPLAADLRKQTEGFVKNDEKLSPIEHFAKTDWKDDESKTPQMLGSFIQRYSERLADPKVQEKIFGHTVPPDQWNGMIADINKANSLGKTKALEVSPHSSDLRSLEHFARAEHRLESIYKDASQLPIDLPKSDLLRNINAKSINDRDGNDALVRMTAALVGDCPNGVCSTTPQAKDVRLFAAMTFDQMTQAAKERGWKPVGEEELQAKAAFELAKSKEKDNLTDAEILARTVNPPGETEP